MKTLRLAIVVAIVFGCVYAFATGARVESMGKNTTFIMDDMSIFDNPANINLYPNFLIGELGTYVKTVERGTNQDPDNPWFGGIFSLNIGADNSLSIAGVLNRKDEKLLKYLPNRIIVDNTEVKAPEPVTNFDGFLGANFDNKAFGVHVYVAHQDGYSGDSLINPNAFASVLQLDLGTNIEISSNYALEVTLGTARIQYGPEDRELFDLDLFSFFAHARLFSRAPFINGHIIPAASFRNMQAPGRDELDITGGIGADAAFDRGFFWIGFQLFYNDQNTGLSWSIDRASNETRYRVCEEDPWCDEVVPVGGVGGKRVNLWQFGGTISFGIERNIWWDWFVIRVGGQKTIAWAKYNAVDEIPYSILCPSKPNINDPDPLKASDNCTTSGNYFRTNPVADGTRDDNVGFGFGINIEEKLKIDFTVAEDLMFRNPFQGEGRLISRVSATYSF